MSPKHSWILVVAMFVVLIVGILVAVDVWRIGGIILVCIAAAIGLIARIGIQSRRSTG